MSSRPLQYARHAWRPRRFVVVVVVARAAVLPYSWRCALRLSARLLKRAPPAHLSQSCVIHFPTNCIITSPGEQHHPQSHTIMLSRHGLLRAQLDSDMLTRPPTVVGLAAPAALLSPIAIATAPPASRRHLHPAAPIPATATATATARPPPQPQPHDQRCSAPSQSVAP